MQVDKKQITKWINALYSGKYKQGFYSLEPHKGYYCCLGVACKIIIPKLKQKKSDHLLFGHTPDEQPGAPEWLTTISIYFEKITGKSLIELNDHDDFSLPEIGMLLQLVYIHKMLD